VYLNKNLRLKQLCYGNHCTDIVYIRKKVGKSKFYFMEQMDVVKIKPQWSLIDSHNNSSVP